jgi:hypothetical protein
MDKGTSKDEQQFLINIEGILSGVLDVEFFILSIAFLITVGLIST